MLELLERELQLLLSRLTVKGVAANFVIKDRECQLVTINFTIYHKGKHVIQKLFDQKEIYTMLTTPVLFVSTFVGELWSDIEEIVYGKPLNKVILLFIA